MTGLLAFASSAAIWTQWRLGICTEYHAGTNISVSLEIQRYIRHGTLLADISKWKIVGEDRNKTLFTSNHGPYRFTRMPFGLENPPRTFLRAMNVLLPRFKWQFFLVYWIDIVIFLRTSDENSNHVRQVLTLLYHNGMILNHKNTNSLPIISSFSVMSFSPSGVKYQRGQLTPNADSNTRLHWQRSDHFQSHRTCFVSWCQISLLFRAAE